MRAIVAGIVLTLLVVTEPVTAQDRPALGPRDGPTTPPADLERVTVGSPAPDFTLEALAGPPVTLSDYRGKRNVILVFYRGWW